MIFVSGVFVSLVIVWIFVVWLQLCAELSSDYFSGWFLVVFFDGVLCLIYGVFFSLGCFIGWVW